MFNFEIKCPHCLNYEGFSIRAPVTYHAKEPAHIKEVAEILSKIPGNLKSPSPGLSYGVAHCPRRNCNGPVLIWFSSPNLQFRNRGEFGQQIEWIYTGPSPHILATWPPVPSADDSENWPEKLRSVFREVQEDTRMKREPARIVGSCRSVLEVALASAGYDKKVGKSLSNRIDAAREAGVLTESMRQWAHKTRMDGNEALHELTATHEEAQELVNFIRTFLEIVFDLPQKISLLSGGELPKAEHSK